MCSLGSELPVKIYKKKSNCYIYVYGAVLTNISIEIWDTNIYLGIAPRGHVI